jgi:prepilin-type N-terminal cleavage/methylation domain-containing protein
MLARENMIMGKNRQAGRSLSGLFSWNTNSGGNYKAGRMAAQRKNHGFTLIEVLAAVVILGLAYVAVLQNFSMSLRNIVRIEQANSATLRDMLAFEEVVWPSDEETELDTSGLPLFMEGRIFQLVVVTSDDGQMTTLKLEKSGQITRGRR